MAHLFKLCKRKKLKASEKEELINNPQALNSWNENLLHNIAKHDGFDSELMTKMIENGHDINNINKRGYTMVHSCLEFCGANKIEKIRWLIDKNFPVVSNKFDATDLFLHKHIYDRLTINSDYLNLLKFLLSKNLLETDLTITKYKHIHPILECEDVETMNWFDTNFKLNYDYADSNVLKGSKHEWYGDGILCRLVRRRKPDLLEFVCKKMDVNLISDVLEGYSAILTCGTYSELEMLYKYGYNDTHGTSKQWVKYIGYILYHPNDCSEGEKSYSYHDKMNFAWGLINKKINDFPVELIKVFQLSVDDISTFIKDKKVKPHKGTVRQFGSDDGKSYYASNVFKEEFPKFIDYINENDTESGIENVYSRTICEQIRKNILEQISFL